MVPARLFVALAVPGPVRKMLFGTMGGVAGARWQSEAQLHCTVRFLGETDRHLTGDIVVALGRVRHPPIDATLNGLGTFERRGRVDTLWIGVSPAAAMRALHAKVDRALELVGIAPDVRAYTPHITLARFGRSVAPPAGVAGSLAPPFPLGCRFEELRLYQSLRGSEGATYGALATYELR